MFAKENSQKPKSMERNIVAKNTSIQGDVISDGDFRIDGTLEGSLKTKGRLIVGVEGFIKGTIEAMSAEVEGKLSGELTVETTLTIKSTANISGEVTIGKLSVEPGATFNATCSMRGSVKELNKHNEERATLKEQSA